MSIREPLVEVQKVHKSFGGVRAIDDLDFAVNEKEVVGLIGPNGSGKSTLLNLIGGAMTPDRGQIKFAGRDITYMSRERRCVKGISRTFQTSRPFLKMTVVQNVTLARLYGRNPAKYKNQAISEAEELLHFADLLGKKDMVANSLSLSERKRLELARALAANPLLLLLDELMAGLNPTEIDKAIDVVKKINEKGTTVIIVEHIVRAVMGLSDRVVVLQVGRKIAEGTPDEIAHNELVLKAYLGENRYVEGR